jgi:hypothetical protein
MRAPQPLRDDALDASRAGITLASELSNAYKRLLEGEAEKRISLGGARLMTALVRRSLQSGAQVLINSYQSYSPVPEQAWHDLHAIYVFALAQSASGAAGPDPGDDARNATSGAARSRIRMHFFRARSTSSFAIWPNTVTRRN